MQDRSGPRETLSLIILRFLWHAEKVHWDNQFLLVSAAWISSPGTAYFPKESDGNISELLIAKIGCVLFVCLFFPKRKVRRKCNVRMLFLIAHQYMDVGLYNSVSGVSCLHVHLNCYKYSILCYNEMSGHDLNSAPEAPIHCFFHLLVCMSYFLHCLSHRSSTLPLIGLPMSSRHILLPKEDIYLFPYSCPGGRGVPRMPSFFLLSCQRSEQLDFLIMKSLDCQPETIYTSAGNGVSHSTAPTSSKLLPLATSWAFTYTEQGQIAAGVLETKTFWHALAPTVS